MYVLYIYVPVSNSQAVLPITAIQEHKCVGKPEKNPLYVYLHFLSHVQ